MDLSEVVAFLRANGLHATSTALLAELEETFRSPSPVAASHSEDSALLPRIASLGDALRNEAHDFPTSRASSPGKGTSEFDDACIHDPGYAKEEIVGVNAWVAEHVCTAASPSQTAALSRESERLAQQRHAGHEEEEDGEEEEAYGKSGRPSAGVSARDAGRSFATAGAVVDDSCDLGGASLRSSQRSDAAWDSEQAHSLHTQTAPGLRGDGPGEEEPPTPRDVFGDGPLPLSGATPSRSGERGCDEASEADAELVRRYYEAREVFEFVGDEAAMQSPPTRAPGFSVSAGASHAMGLGETPPPPPPQAHEAPLAPPPHHATPHHAAPGGFGAAFTFSPVSAPSPPMSAAGFSWRSEDGEEGDAEFGERDEPRSPGGHSLGDDDEAGGHGACDGTPPAPAQAPSRAEAVVPPRVPYVLAFDDSPYDVLELRCVHRRGRTGFEEEKEFPATVGTVVAGRYQITELLGSAAFSRAVQAHDLQSGALVCMKIIKNSKDFFDQSLDEIKLLKLLNAADPSDEKGLLRLYDYFYFKEHLFIVTELLRANLYEFSKYNRASGDEPYFTPRRLQRIAGQVLQSLAFMHSLGVIHADLKPENILIASYSRCVVKVIDVGSSCFVSDHLSSYVQSRSYRAPEVILGAPYDARIDVWSLGCVLAELHSGSVLFQNESLATLLARLVGTLGPLPPCLLAGRHAHKFVTRSGALYERDEATGRAWVLRPKMSDLSHRLEGAAPEFVAFVAALLTPDPALRPTAEEALRLPWMSLHVPDSPEGQQ